MSGDMRPCMDIHDRLGFTVKKVDPHIKGSSIPLILPDTHEYSAATGRVSRRPGVERRGLYVVPEAISLLKQVQEPLSVLAIAGPMRTGKSYILSRLVGAHDAFALGNTFDPETFGIWMGTEIIRGKDKHGQPFALLLLDTEGIDAPSAAGSQDAGIFVLSILLCSRLIYNSQNVPYKKDLDKLQCFSQLASGVQVRHNSETQLGDDQHFPHFLWLLRDVSLMPPADPNDPKGRPMDPTDYIKTKVLKRGGSLMQTNADTTAQVILSLFRDVQAYTLVPPGPKEVLQNIAARCSDLTPEFEAGVRTLIEKLLTESGTILKKGFENGAKVTGEMLAAMATSYVTAVNDPNAIPAMDDTWRSALELIVAETKESLVAEYKEKMRALIEAASREGDTVLPLPEHSAETLQVPALIDMHQMVYSELTKSLMDKVGHFGFSTDKPDALENLTNDFRHRIVQYKQVVTKVDGERVHGSEVCGGALWPFIQANRELSQQYCTYLYNKLFAPIKDKIENHISNYEFADLVKDLQQLTLDYEAHARGPAKATVMAKMDTEVSENHKHNFKKMKGYQKKALEQEAARKKAENEQRQKDEQVKKLHNDMVAMQEEHKVQQEHTQQAFDTQMEQVRKDEAQKREEEMQKIRDLQTGGYAEFGEMMKEMVAQQSKSTELMMQQMQSNQEGHSKQMAELVKSIANMPPPRVITSGGGCVIS